MKGKVQPKRAACRLMSGVGREREGGRRGTDRSQDTDHLPFKNIYLSPTNHPSQADTRYRKRKTRQTTTNKADPTIARMEPERNTARKWNGLSSSREF